MANRDWNHDGKKNWKDDVYYHHVVDSDGPSRPVKVTSGDMAVIIVIAVVILLLYLIGQAG